MNRADARAQLVAVGERLAQAGLVRDSEGNLSVRLDAITCVMTATGTDLGRLDDSGLIELRIDEESAPSGASCSFTAASINISHFKAR